MRESKSRADVPVRLSGQPGPGWTLGVLALLFLLVGGPTPARARLLEFPYRDRALLLPEQELGARLWLPDTPDPKKRYQLIVLLHGLNKRGALYPLLSSGEGEVNLVAVAERLIAAGQVRPDFVLAAPTQTRDAAKGATLWTRFDLKGFIREVRRHLPREVKLQDRPVVAGHSGAGCNEHGGLWWIAQQHGGWLAALVVMDTCLSAALGRHLYRYLWPEPGDATANRTTAKSWLLHFWQPRWKRDVEAFEDAMHFQLQIADGTRGTHLLKRNGRRWLSAQVDGTHSEMVEQIFAEALLRLYPSPTTLALLKQELVAIEQEKQRLRAEKLRQAREAREARRAAARVAAEERARMRAEAAQRKREAARLAQAERVRRKAEAKQAKEEQARRQAETKQAVTEQAHQQTETKQVVIDEQLPRTTAEPTPPPPPAPSQAPAPPETGGIP